VHYVEYILEEIHAAWGNTELMKPTFAKGGISMISRSSLLLSLCTIYALAFGFGWIDDPPVKGLPGWHVQEGKAECWKFEHGVISSAPGGGFLTMDKEYGDFHLTLEYRMKAGGNSGVGVHYPPGGHPSTTGIEIQVLDDDAPAHKNIKPTQANGSIYKHVAPLRKAAKPLGEWNKMEITCKDPWIDVKLNGIGIQHANRDEYPNTEGNGIPLAKLPRKGCIGLQSHGEAVEVRNVHIKGL
jgi:hypothetical protein